MYQIERPSAGSREARCCRLCNDFAKTFIENLMLEYAEGMPAGGWHPEETLTAYEALRGFTLDAAYAGFAEDEAASCRASAPVACCWPRIRSPCRRRSCAT